MSGSLPLILALDTAQEDCAAALLKGTELIGSRVETVGSRHSEIILPMIRDLLKDSGVEKTDLSLIAFGAGPGSFTGPVSYTHLTLPTTCTV